MNLALTITRHNHIVLAHVANNEIPRLRYLRLMTQQQPRLRENPFHLQPVKLLVGHYPKDTSFISRSIKSSSVVPSLSTNPAFCNIMPLLTRILMTSMHIEHFAFKMYYSK